MYLIRLYQLLQVANRNSLREISTNNNIIKVVGEEALNYDNGHILNYSNGPVN